MKTLRLVHAQQMLTPSGVRGGSRLAPKGSVLVLVRGMTLHKDVPLGVARVPMAFNQDVKALVPNETHIDPEYLPYALLALKGRLLGLVDSASHGTGRIHSYLLQQLDVPTPARQVQRAIADFLGALDDKADANLVTVKLAESLARRAALEHLSDVDRVPLGELAELVRSLVDPANLDTVDHYSIPALDQDGLPETVNGADIKSQKNTLPGRCVLVSRINPRIPRVWFAAPPDPTRAVASTEFAVLRPRKREIAAELLHTICSSRFFSVEMASRATGTSTSHQRVQPDDMLRILVPDIARLPERVAGRCVELVSLAHELRLETRRLVEMRDRLLPGIADPDGPLAPLHTSARQ